MANIVVEKVLHTDELPPSLLEQVITTADKIRQRALEVFRNRGDAADRSLDDWLQAERETILSPETELIEKNGIFSVRVAVPGFDAADLHVTAIPGALIVYAKARHKHENGEGDVYLCEFGQRQLFRWLDLPAPINPDRVTANLEQGILQVTAGKAVDSANKVKAIAAA
jgi:HSP20 family molecular chaperone IbpA